MTKEQTNRFIGLLMGREDDIFLADTDFLDYMRWLGQRDYFDKMIRDICKGIYVEIEIDYVSLFYTDIEWSLGEQMEWYKVNKDLWGYEECPSTELCFDTYDENLIPPHKFCREELDCKGMTKTRALKYLEEQNE